MLVYAGDPVLRRRAALVPAEALGTAELDALVTRMIDTMRRAPGVGLAAPQIGVGLRVIVVEDRPEYQAEVPPSLLAERERTPVDLRVIVNPVLRTIADGQATFLEGCLSVPGYVALVSRDLEVEVRGVDGSGAPVAWRTRGWPARILQHELDHLEGTLYVDRMIPRSLAFVAPDRRAVLDPDPIETSLRDGADAASGKDGT